MANMLEELQVNLERSGNPVAKFLNPPLSDFSKMHEFVANFYGPGLQLPDGVEDLYQWHNGVNLELPNVFPQFFNMIPTLTFMSQERMIVHTTNGGDVYELTNYKLLPVFLDLNGGFLCFSLNPKDKKLYYSSMWSPELDLHTSMFDSYETFIKTINEAYATGAFLLDNEEGAIDHNDTYYDIGKRYNPKSDYWNIMA